MELTRTYIVNCTGLTPLLMHSDDVEWSDSIKAWRDDPANKRFKVAGDDRSPAWTWIGYLWHDGTVVGIPAEAIGKGVMKAGARVPVPGGKNGRTFKEQTQSGMAIVSPLAPLVVRGKQIKIDDLRPYTTEMKFSEHVDAAKALGFGLSIKRAPVGQSKHVRVRPRFDDWAFSVAVEVWDEQITDDILTSIFSIAGGLGVGDWRPSAPKSPGPYGRYAVEVKRQKK